MATNQVSEVPLGEVSSRHEADPSHKRARVSTYTAESWSSRSGGDRSRTAVYGTSESRADFLPAWRSSISLPPVAELPSEPPSASNAARENRGSYYGGDRDRDCDHKREREGHEHRRRHRHRHHLGDPRSASPTPSYASSSATTLSAATTTATALSSRASLSSCRSSLTSSSPSWSSSPYSGGGRGGRCSSSSSSSSSSSRRRADQGYRSSSKGSAWLSSTGSVSSRSSYSSSSRQASSATSGGGAGADLFPKPSSSWRRSSSGGGGGSSVDRRRRGSPGAARRRDGSSRDRYTASSGSSSRGSRDWHYGGCPPLSRRAVVVGGHKDYASEAGGSTSTGSSTSSAGRKRNRSCSRERERGRGGSSSCSSRRSAAESSSSSSGGVECARCLEWCRHSRAQQGKPITRTLQMDYYVRTPGCKAAKSKHIDFIDDVAFSREQFIEETVFTCPFTGAQRDTVLERNMFPYDVPTDVEHWTLWSRKDLSEAEMETFVQAWAAENHPHVVEWECDNNEGERSIDWFHVHVFFRLGCEDRTGVPRDPASVYDGPYRPRDDEAREPEAEDVGEAENGEAVPVAAGCGGGEPEAGWGRGAEDDAKKDEEEEAMTDHE